MKTNLDCYSSEYLPGAATAIENELILNWYPKRIISRFGYAEALLELGLGHGYTAKIFSEACERHVIIDGSSSIISQFQQRSPEFCGEIIHSYFEDCSPDGLFDVIVMGFVLEHVDSPSLILESYRKFLKPNGKLYVTVPNAKSLNRRLGLELGLIDDIYSLNANDIAQGHQRQYSREILKETVEKAGYIISYEEGIYLKPLPLNVLKTLDNFSGNLQAMLHVGVDFPDLCVGLLMELEAD